MTTYLLPLLISLITLSLGIKVQCEYEPIQTRTHEKFYITEREVLVPTIYGVSLVVDDWDGSVSNYIKMGGSW